MKRRERSTNPRRGRTHRTTLVDPNEDKLIETRITFADGEEQQITVTGEWLYPTYFVLASLGLQSLASRDQKKSFLVRLRVQEPFFSSETARLRSERKLRHSCVRRQRVLSLGEGTSGLVPFLLDQVRVPQVVGLDPSYGHANLLARLPRPHFYSFFRRYLRRWSGHLVAGSALATPFAEQSIDLILSHRMIEAFSETSFHELLVEVERLLRPNGQARFAFTAPTEDSFLHPLLLDKLLREHGLEFVIQAGSLEISSKADAETIYPTDALPWHEWQSAVFSDRHEASYARVRVGQPCHLEMIGGAIVTLYLEKATPS